MRCAGAMFGCGYCRPRHQCAMRRESWKATKRATWQFAGGFGLLVLILAAWPK